MHRTLFSTAHTKWVSFSQLHIPQQPFPQSYTYQGSLSSNCTHTCAREPFPPIAHTVHTFHSSYMHQYSAYIMLHYQYNLGVQ